jgi:hypothetical protein
MRTFQSKRYAKRVGSVAVDGIPRPFVLITKSARLELVVVPSSNLLTSLVYQYGRNGVL